MSAKEEVEREIREFLSKHDNMIPQDRVAYLMAIFDKQLLFSQMEYQVQNFQVQNILNNAKSIMGGMTLPVIISEKEMEPGQTGQIAVVESILQFLNGNGLLKKIVKLNYSKHMFKMKD